MPTLGTRQWLEQVKAEIIDPEREIVGIKKMVADFSEDEKTAMFSKTATKVYRL